MTFRPDILLPNERETERELQPRPYLGYLLESERVKTVQVTKPTETCMNGDGLDPALGLMWWNFGYLYPPSMPPWGTTKVLPYIRHGKGSNYSWVDGHVSMTPWSVMSKGANGKIDWFYLATPDQSPSF